MEHWGETDAGEKLYPTSVRSCTSLQNRETTKGNLKKKGDTRELDARRFWTRKKA